MKAQLALRMKYRLKAVRKRHYVPHGSGARARAKFPFIARVLSHRGRGRLLTPGTVREYY